MFAFLSFLLSLVFSVESLTYECNFVNMGFGVIQPVGQCVIGKHAQYEAPMSMEQICIDPYTVETRLYQNIDCDGDTYEVVDQFDCQDEAEFVECECHHHVTELCPLVTDYRYERADDGTCDKTKYIEFRKHVVMDAEDIPQPMQLEDSCFERISSCGAMICNGDEKDILSKGKKMITSFTERLKSLLHSTLPPKSS